MTTQEAWQKQSERTEFYRKNYPDLLIRKIMRSESEKLNEIGISNLSDNKPLGYLRLYPEDFIVEEIMLNGQIAKINNLEIVADKIKTLGENTLYCQLIKISIPTNVAITRIAHTFKIDENKIGRAGLKDSEVITSQLIAFLNLNFSHINLIII